MRRFDELAETLLVMVETVAIGVQNAVNSGVPLETWDGQPNPDRCSLRVLPVGIAPSQRTIEVRDGGADFGRPYLVEVVLHEDRGAMAVRLTASKWIESYPILPGDRTPLPGQAERTLRAMLTKQVWAGREHKRRQSLGRIGIYE
jgi:hypothetical protein